VTNPHTIIQALDGAAHVCTGNGDVQLDVKEWSIPSTEASLSLSAHGARALAAMLLDAAERAESA